MFGRRRRRACHGWLVAACLVGITAPSSEGRTQPQVARHEAEDDAALARARAAFKLGTALAKQGQWPEALAAYQRAQTQHPHAATTYNIGFCLRALGRTTAARVAFLRALDEGRERPGELPPRLEKDARAFLRELEGKIVRLTITLRGERATLTVDGRPLHRAADGAYVAGIGDTAALAASSSPFVLQLDPGEHAIVVEQRGKSDVITVDYQAGAVDSLTLGSEPSVAKATGSDHRPAAYVAFGMAGTAAIAGIVAGSIALATRSSLDDSCTPQKVCPEDDGPAIRRLQHAADIATTSFVVAGAAAGLATVLLFTSAHDDVEVGIGPGQARLRWRF